MEKRKVYYLERGTIIIFKGQQRVTTNLCQCGTKKLRDWVDNMKFSEPWLRS